MTLRLLRFACIYVSYLSVNPFQANTTSSAICFDGAVRWESLFADLEAQSAALDVAARAAEVDERTRGELATLGLSDRLHAAIGQPLRIDLAGRLHVAGRLARTGPDWLLVEPGPGRETVVVTAQIRRVRGLGRFSRPPDSSPVVQSRLGLRHVLRGLARDRSAVHVHLVDGVTVDATLDRVGADFAEVATHAPGESRRRGDVRDVELIPFAAIAGVRRGSG
jgi:hypothetical protein